MKEVAGLMFLASIPTIAVALGMCTFSATRERGAIIGIVGAGLMLLAAQLVRIH